MIVMEQTRDTPVGARGPVPPGLIDTKGADHE